MRRGGTVPKLTLAGLVNKIHPTSSEREVVRVLSEVYDLLKVWSSQMDQLSTTCSHCGNPLYTRSDIKKYCSASCRAMAHNISSGTASLPGTIKSDFVRVTTKRVKKAKTRNKH